MIGMPVLARKQNPLATMQRHFIIALLIAGGIYPRLSAAQEKTGGARPNIILIMSDDMGYSDLGCYGGEIHTPNLDSLAMHGLRYTRFYNMGHCCPSRAALMTGLYPQQTGLGWMTDRDFHLPGYTNELNDRCVTIAEVLKMAGYQTFMAGKWHLSHNIRAGGPQHDWPLQRGFDRFYGILAGAGNYYDPASLCRDNTLITPENDPQYHPRKFYFTDAISDNAVRFVRDRPKDGKPFFMYVAYTAAHWPMQAPEEAVAQYRGRYDAGWDVLRRQRFEREKALGVIDSDAVLSASDTHPWSEETDKEAMARRMETYAAMVTVMDQGIGKIVDELKKEGIFNNTMIIFLQDNGGNAEGTGFGGPAGESRPVAKDTAGLKPLGKDEVQYSINPPITRDGRIVMQGKDVMAGPADTYLAYLKPWAHMSNTPFRKYKNFVYEGGIATPLIIHWPDGIQAERGAIRTQPGHEIDIMPTIVRLASARYPRAFNGKEITPVAGIDLTPTFDDKPLPERAIYWSHQANRAMLLGKWKIVSGGILHGPYGQWKTYSSLPWQLFNMETDRSELTDLSAQYPDIVLRMAAMWEKWAHEANVYPMPWEREKPTLRRQYMSTPWEFPDF